MGPVVFVAVLLSLRPVVIDAVGEHVGYMTVGTVLILSAAAFGWFMFRLIDQAHTAIVDGERQTAALAERERIARELHDSLAQVLGVAHLRLRGLAGSAGLQSDPPAAAEVGELADLCHEAYADVREAILGLRNAGRPDRTLLEHLDSYVAAFARTSAIDTTLVTDASSDLGLQPAAELQVIRVIQEALTNVRKHSGARRAVVRIQAARDHTEFVVEDDGAGFDAASAPHADAFGLSAMRERTASVAGRLHIDSAPGRGTRVIVRVPARPGSPVLAFPTELSA